MQVQLTTRQQHVLWATVRHYIATAEPVGSKALGEEYKLRVSPATIRHAMGVLEKVGLLYQPHTSAGRVPSDSGYRIYVDQLITPSEVLTRQVEQLLQERLRWEDWSLEALLQGAAQILATVSGCITIVTMPQANTARLRHLQLVQTDPERVMLIVVTDTYETRSALMNLPKLSEETPLDTEVVERELQILSNFLNSQLRGRSLCEIATLDWSQLDKEFQRYGDFLKTFLVDISRRAQPPASTQIMIRGVAEVLRQPEFSQLQQVKTIIHLLEEEQDQLWDLIFEQHGSCFNEGNSYGQSHASFLNGGNPSTELASQVGKPTHSAALPPEIEKKARRRVAIRIGSENTLEPIRTCTLISSTYSRGSVPVGSVGVLGPTRMDYETAIAVVEAAADYLSEALR